MKRFIALFLLSVLAVSPASFALGDDVSISGSERVSGNAYLGGGVIQSATVPEV